MRTGLRAIKRYSIESLKRMAAEYKTPEQIITETYGGIVTRTIIRTAFDDGQSETISFDQALFEFGDLARVKNSFGTKFEKFEGTANAYFKWRLSEIEKGTFKIQDVYKEVIGELFDEGITFQTKYANYQLGERVIEKGEKFAQKAVA